MNVIGGSANTVPPARIWEVCTYCKWEMGGEGVSERERERERSERGG